MRACCVRSASTAPRPISIPTSPRITTSISKTTTNWSTFRIRIWFCRKCRKCPKATRSPGSTWSSGCARSADAPWVAGSSSGTKTDYQSQRRWLKSLHLLIGVDAPQPLLFEPAIETVAGDVAPACCAALDLGHDAGLQARDHRAGRVGTIVERREFVLGLHGDHGGAAARQQRVIDPALRAFGIPHPAPVLEFRGDFNRQAGPGVDPGDVVIFGRASPDVHVIGFEADIAWNQQPASTTTEQKRPNAIHSSPAEIPTQILRLKHQPVP